MKLFEFLKKAPQNFEVYAPVSGRVVSLDEVPDEVFKNRTLGDGVAIIPTDNVICAPADGKLSTVFETGHAFVIDLANNVSVLVHIGIDTVRFNGECFKAMRKTGDDVKKGEPVIEADLEFIRTHNTPDICPIVLLDREDGKEYNLEKLENSAVTKGTETIIKGEIK